MQQEKIFYHVQRDFGQTFTTTFKFIKRNFKVLFKSCLFIAGPFILVSSIAGAVYQATAANPSLFLSSGLSSVFSFEWFLTIIFALFGFTMLVVTVYSYMLVYETKEIEERITVEDVWQEIKMNFWITLGTFFASLLLTIGAVLIIALLAGGLGAIAGAFGVLFVFLLFIGMMILFPVLFHVFTAVYLIRMKERVGYFASIRRGFYAIKGKFWWTWLIMFVILFVWYIVSFIFQVPTLIVSMILIIDPTIADGEIYQIVYYTITAIFGLLAHLTYILPFVAVAFHHFSTLEGREGTGTLSRIDSLGTNSYTDEDAGHVY